MFPGPGASIIRNEAGEPIGWDYPADDATALYCDKCGVTHVGLCDFGDDEDERDLLPHDIEMNADGLWWCVTENVNADECADYDRCQSMCVCNQKDEEESEDA